MKRFTIHFLLIFFLSINSFGQTEISGGIYENTIWTVEESPYIITG
ncbi:MAG: hypothetical protein GQ574_07505 [Crocinitomix sp.]|nr:hypothetical protein [Crocinitomix sp.]